VKMLRTSLFFTCLLALCVGPAVHGQSLLGTINGQVTDSARKLAPGAKVKLVQEETNKSRTATSDGGGDFRFTLLPPGTYRLEVEHTGFRRHVQTLILQMNQELRVDVPLLPGNLSEQVTVTATRGMLRTASAALGGVVENEQVTGLPLDGRNFYELSLLLPGVAPAASGSAGSVRGDFAININGAREDSNYFLLDGVFNGDPKLNGFAVQPPVDAIQEFEVLSNAYDASFGRNVGGQISVVTKSGGNHLHGTAYEFFRNAATDARNFFAPGREAKPQYQRNQFGASLGGPLRRDRTFFFVDYEGRRLNEGITRVTNVPTALERSGDFSKSFAPPINPFTQQPFPGNQIPSFFQNPVGQKIAALYPQPNRSVPGQNFVSSPVERDNDHHFDVRVDHALTSRDDLTLRYSFNDRSLFEPFTGPAFPMVPGYGDNVPRRAQNAMIRDVHTFSPRCLNELRLGFSRVAAGAFPQGQGTSINRQVGLPEFSSNPRDFGLSYLTVTGYSPLGDEYNNPQFSATNNWQIADQATLVHGRQQAKFGFDFRYLQQNAFRDIQSRGFLNFQGAVTGNPLADLLLGLPTVTGGARLDNPQHLRAKSYGFFGQYNTRLGRDLDLAVGLRYEFNSPPVDTRDRANLYDPATGQLAQVGTKGIPRGGYQPDRNNLGPRIGLAWNPKGGPWVFRSGYGVYYDQASLAPGEGLYFNQPYFDFKLFFQYPGLPPLTLADPFPKNFPIPVPGSAFTYQRDLRTAYTQQWNVGVQRQLGKRRVFEVAYVGSKGTKLLAARDLNQARPSAAPQNLRPNPFFADINVAESRASSNYHSLQARFQQQLSRGLALLTSYTWSKSLDDASSFFTSAGDANFPQDSRNVRAERGRSNFDVRQRLVMSYSYDLPVARNHRWLGGWQTYGIWTFQTGRPFTVALLPDIDNSNTGRSSLGFGANNRPNRAASGSLSNPTADRWFNTAVFVTSPFGTFGNSGRNILDGPGLQSFNVSLVKNTTLREGLSAQFRAEAFNLFNRPNFDLPDIFVGSPSFGKITSAQSPRRVQFGVKLLF